jgi:hypothetical protein
MENTMKRAIGTMLMLAQLALMPALALAQSPVPEGSDITPLSDGTMVYGTPMSWAPVKAVKSGLTYTCNNSTFGPDPAPGKGKTCTFMPGQPPKFRAACVTQTIGGTGGQFRNGWDLSIAGVALWFGWTCPGNQTFVVVCRGLGCDANATPLPLTDPSISDLYTRAVSTISAAK